MRYNIKLWGGKGCQVDKFLVITSVEFCDKGDGQSESLFCGFLERNWVRIKIEKDAMLGFLNVVYKRILYFRVELDFDVAIEPNKSIDWKYLLICTWTFMCKISYNQVVSKSMTHSLSTIVKAWKRIWKFIFGPTFQVQVNANLLYF